MDNTPPIYYKSRSVPYAFRDKVEAVINRLVQENVIMKVVHTDWSAPIVVVPKANKTVRICGYIKVTTNPNVELDHYPLRNVDDFYTSLASDKVFSQLDVLHIPAVGAGCRDTTLFDREHPLGNLYLPATRRASIIFLLVMDQIMKLWTMSSACKLTIWSRLRRSKNISMFWMKYSHA